jgi:hypothetical protein
MEGFLHAGLLHIGIIAPSVSADGAITTKITRVVTPGPPLPPFGTPYIPKTQVDLGRLAGRTTGGHHPIHGGRPSENPYNRRRKKGVADGEAFDKSHDGSLDHRPIGNTIPRSRSTLANTGLDKP